MERIERFSGNFLLDPKKRLLFCNQIPVRVNVTIFASVSMYGYVANQWEPAKRKMRTRGMIPSNPTFAKTEAVKKTTQEVN